MSGGVFLSVSGDVRRCVSGRNSQQAVGGLPTEQAPDVVPSLTSYPSVPSRPMQTADHMSLAAHAAKGDYRDASGFSTTDLYHMGNRSLSQDMYTPYNQGAAAIKYPSHTSPSALGLGQPSPAPPLGPLGLRRSPAAHTATPAAWGQQGYGRSDVSMDRCPATSGLVHGQVPRYLRALGASAWTGAGLPQGSRG